MLALRPTKQASWWHLASAAIVVVFTGACLLGFLQTTPAVDLPRLLQEPGHLQAPKPIAAAMPPPPPFNATGRCAGRPGPARIALITGINGMIGSHVARALLDRRRSPCYEVVGLVRPRSDLSTLAGVLEQIVFVVGDLTDSHRLLTLVDEVGADVVFHFAAQAINGISFGLPQTTIDANVQGTINLFEAIRRSRRALSSAAPPVRVLVAGSSTEYGQAAERHTGPIPETLSLDPVTPYGISKVASEKLANQYVIAAGLEAVTARLFIHVGVGGTDSLAIHQFCKQTALAELGLAPPVVRHGNLETARDITDARDSAPVLVALAERGVPGQAYNVGSGNTIAIKDMLDQVLRLAQVEMLHELDPRLLRPFDEKVLVADITKVQALTGWRPGTDMRETVANILAYWRRKVQALYCVEDDDGVNPCRAPAPDHE